MFWVIRFILFWLAFIFLADKHRWREILPVCFFAGFLGATTDNIIHHFHLWIFDSTQTAFIADITDDWTVYIVVTYLFLQWLPRNKTFYKMAVYWFIWTGISAIIELIHVYTGHMTYIKWNIGWSYLADWILFYIFYKYHQIFELEKLNGMQKRP